MRHPEWLELIDHTADTGIRVRADSLRQLFARAAQGMFHLLADLDTVRPAVAVPVTVEAGDRVALMVRWLSELNFVHQTEHQLFRAFDVASLSDTRLQAVARGEPIDPARHRVFGEIKAVTFHGLTVERSGDTWEAHILFDV